MKKFLALLALTLFAGGLLHCGERFESASKVIKDYIEEEISKGMDPKVVSTNIFFKNPNWLKNLYKCTLLAKNNKRWNNENSHEFDDCIRFFNKIEQYAANNHSDKKNVINKITYFKDYFAQEEKRYLREQEKYCQELKKSDEIQNFHRVKSLLNSLKDEFKDRFKDGRDYQWDWEDSFIINSFLSECYTALDKESLQLKDKFKISLCHQFFGIFKEIAVDRKTKNQSLVGKCFEKIFNLPDIKLEALDKLQVDIEKKNNNPYRMDQFNKIFRSTIEDHWQQEIVPLLGTDSILNKEPDNENERNKQNYFRSQINECRKLVKQKGPIGDPDVYNAHQYRLCGDALDMLIDSIKGNDSYLSNFLGYTQKKVGVIQEMREYLKLVHQQNSSNIFLKRIKSLSEN